jgi:hypothetical protein
MRLTEDLPDQTLLEIREAIEHKIEEHHIHDTDKPASLGRTSDRRHHNDPNYRGPERRKGNNRRV